MAAESFRGLYKIDEQRELLFELQRGKTLVVAAHRLSTVRNADKNLFMRNGKIVEQGTHEELIAMKGEYYHLVENQLEISQ